MDCVRETGEKLYPISQKQCLSVLAAGSVISGLCEFFWRKFQNSGVTAVMVSTGPIVRKTKILMEKLPEKVLSYRMYVSPIGRDGGQHNR